MSSTPTSAGSNTGSTTRTDLRRRRRLQRRVVRQRRRIRRDRRVRRATQAHPAVALLELLAYHRPMPLLVGDRERDRAAHELQRHYREGRLSVDELAQRLETALRARNAGQLRSALSELPGAWRLGDPVGVREALRSPARGLRNAAIL